MQGFYVSKLYSNLGNQVYRRTINALEEDKFIDAGRYEVRSFKDNSIADHKCKNIFGRVRREIIIDFWALCIEHTCLYDKILYIGNDTKFKREGVVWGIDAVGVNGILYRSGWEPEKDLHTLGGILTNTDAWTIHKGFLYVYTANCENLKYRIKDEKEFKYNLAQVRILSRK